MINEYITNNKTDLVKSFNHTTDCYLCEQMKQWSDSQNVQIIRVLLGDLMFFFFSHDRLALFWIRARADTFEPLQGKSVGNLRPFLLRVSIRKWSDYFVNIYHDKIAHGQWVLVYTETRVISSTHRNVVGIVRSRGKIAQVLGKNHRNRASDSNDSI